MKERSMKLGPAKARNSEPAAVVKVQVPDDEPPYYTFDFTPETEYDPTDPEVYKDAVFKHPVVGRNVTRLDGVAKVTGAAKYTHDMNSPGMLYGYILRSAHPAAVIKAIDTSVAEKMPGVKAIAYAFEENKTGEKQMRYAGEEILAIAAETLQQAEDAARTVKVEYEKRYFVVDADEARKSGAPLVHEDKPGNLGKPRTQGKAEDVERILAGSHKTVEATYRTQVQTHVCLETHGLVVKPEGDRLVVYASTQGTFSVRDGLAEALGIPAEKIDVITHYMGGGFGSKFGPRPEGVLCARLAMTAKAPVKLMLTRKGEHLSAGNRPSSVQQVKIGCDQQGKLTGISVRIYGTGGIAGGAGARNPAVYDFKDAVFKEEVDVFTNAGPACAMRAPGCPQGFFALEQAMDELAHQVRMDPLKFRMQNDTDPIRAEEYGIGAKEIEWETRRNKEAGKGELKGSKRRGIGMASTMWFQAGGKNAHADVEIHRNGDVVLLQGAQDLGTGFRTAMGIIVAEELGLQPSHIITRIGETRFGYGPGSGGSTTTPTVAPAVRAAAYKAKTQLQEAVSSHLNSRPEEVWFRDGYVYGSDDSGGRYGNPKRMTWKQACAMLSADKITGAGDRRENYAGYRDTVAGVQFAEVEVDVETGEIRVVKVVAVQDAGVTLNKLTCESQICGGVIQGISYALFENRVMDRNVGHMVNPNMMEYKIAGPRDCPLIVPIVYQVSNGKNSVGAMGMGEPPVIATPAAIANAVFNALGVRIREMPITPDRILAALAKKGGTVA